MRKTVLTLVVATFLLSTAGTASLAKIILPNIDDIDTRELEPRSGTLERDRHILLLRKLMEIATACRAKGDLEDALAATLAAKKIDKDYNHGNRFERFFDLAYLYGDMNRWRDAQREFDRLMICGNSSTAAEIVKYALDHKKLDIANAYEKYLKDACEPDILLVYSRLLSTNGKKSEAIEVAKQAYGLSAAFGLDQAKAISALSELQGVKPEKLVADKSFEKQFWEKVDKLKTLAKCPTPSYARSLVSTPSWSALFEDAQDALRKRNFIGCKRKLTKAFNVWTAERNAQPGDYAVRRKQYAQLKDLFIALYTAWEKPKIADYFKTAILPDIQRENDNVLFEIMSDFPTAKHQTWKVKKVSADCFDIYAGEQGFGVARKGGKVYDALVRLVGENPDEEKIIEPPPMVLIDDECFTENPLFR